VSQPPQPPHQPPNQPPYYPPGTPPPGYQDPAGSVLHRPQGGDPRLVPGQRPPEAGPPQHYPPQPGHAAIAMARPAAAVPAQAQAAYPQYQTGTQPAVAPVLPVAQPATGQGVAAGQGVATGQGVGTGHGTGQSVAVAAAQAASQAAGAVLTRGTGGALATPPPPPGPRGTVYQHTSGPAGDSSHRRLARLRVGSHVATPAALELLTSPSPGAGLLIGADRDRQPVLVRLFRPEPTEIVLVGGVWAARLLAFRALALGAAVYTATTQPTPWDGLGAHAVGHHERVQLSTVEPGRLPPAAAHRPVMVIRDTGPGRAGAPLGPWQTRITVVRQLDHNGMSVLSTADLTMMQRLAPDEAQLAAYALRMSAQSTQLVQMLEPEMLALMGGGANRYVWLRLTAVERQLLGAPQR
jgi:hypothetical protein